MSRKRKRGWGRFKKQRVPPDVQRLLNSSELTDIILGLRLASLYVCRKKWENIHTTAFWEAFKKVDRYLYIDRRYYPYISKFKIIRVLKCVKYERREDQPIIEFKRPKRPDTRPRIIKECEDI